MKMTFISSKVEGKQPTGRKIKEWLRGSNPRIASAAAMVKTTPPGRGSRLLTPSGDDPVHALGVEAPCGARLLATGAFSDDDLGVSCYHSKTGAVELYLNHLVDSADEYVVADLTAGADSFASGLFTRFDLTVLVCEPTRKGVSVWRQWQSYAAGYDVAVTVAGNKILGTRDLEFLNGETGGGPVAWFGHEPAVRAMEQGRAFELRDLSEQTLSGLGLLRAALDHRWAARDWAAYTRQAAEFHLRNAAAWAAAATGEDLAAQIDPDFVLGPDALAVMALSGRNSPEMNTTNRKFITDSRTIERAGRARVAFFCGNLTRSVEGGTSAAPADGAAFPATRTGAARTARLRSNYLRP